MSRFNKLLSNFKSGEMSPKFYGRKDLEEYSGGAQLFSNFIPKTTGGFSKRMGSQFIADVTNLSVSLRGPALLPFISTKKEAYVIVINPAGVLGSVTPYIRIFKNDGSESTVSPFLDVEAPPNDLDPKGFITAQIGDFMWVTHNSGRFRPIVIARRSSSTDDFAVIDHTLNTITNDNNFAQINTVLKQPFRDTNISAITIRPSLLTGSITLTAGADFFNNGHVNALLKITHGNTTGVVRINSVTSPTLAAGTVLIDFGANTASDNWEESAWSVFRGYPRTVTSFEQRLVWGGNTAQPDTLWFSLLGNVFQMMQKRFIQDLAGDTTGLNFFLPTTTPDEKKVFDGLGNQFLEDDPFSITLAANEPNPITWMSSGRSLLVGTLGAEYIISSEGAGLSILTISARKQTSYGGAPTKPVRVANEAIFLSRDGKRLRTFKFNEENGSYVSADISITGEHLRRVGDSIFTDFDSNLEWLDTSHQNSKDIIWLINSKSNLIGVVYSRENGNISWFRTVFPNSSFPPVGGGSLNIWGITSTPNLDGGSDDLWIIVERPNTAGRVYTLERVGQDFEGETLTEQPVIEENLPAYLDSHIVINNLVGAAITTVTGLDHLEGNEVTVMYRGELIGLRTVDGSGEISFVGDAPALAKLNVGGMGFAGIPYTAEFETLDIEAGGDLGFSEGHVQRIERAYVRFDKTRQARVGSITRQDPVKFNHSSTIVLFTGVKRVNVPNSPGIEQRIKITSSEAQPCNVMSIAIRGSTDD